MPETYISKHCKRLPRSRKVSYLPQTPILFNYQDSLESSSDYIKTSALDFRHQGERTFGISLGNRFMGMAMNKENLSRILYAVNGAVQNYGERNNISFNTPKGFFEHVSEAKIDHVAHSQDQDWFTVITDDKRINPGMNAWVSDFKLDHTNLRLEMTYQIAEVSLSNENIEIPSNMTLDQFWEDACSEKTYIEKHNPFHANFHILIKSRAKIIPYHRVSEPEAKAMETLREMITETEFRKYLKYGFILVKGKSGRVYQIFRDKHHTKVWHRGLLIEEVCVRLTYGVPPTDNVIAFKAAIETDEEDFKKLGNVYKMAEAA